MSKLEELVANRSFGADAINFENGMMYHKPHKVLVDYVVLEYPTRFEVYLSLYDEGEPPFRNYLVKGTAKTKEKAKEIAVRKLDGMVRLKH